MLSCNIRRHVGSVLFVLFSGPPQQDRCRVPTVYLPNGETPGCYSQISWLTSSSVVVGCCAKFPPYVFEATLGKSVVSASALGVGVDNFFVQSRDSTTDPSVHRYMLLVMVSSVFRMRSRRSSEPSFDSSLSRQCSHLMYLPFSL